MRDISLSIIALLLLGFVSCKQNKTPEPAKPATIGGLTLKQQNGSDCNKPDSLRVDCAQVDLAWPKVEQGSEALKKSVDQWATACLAGVLMPSADGPATSATTLDAAVKGFFEDHQNAGRSITSGGWVAESNYNVLLNDGQFLTLELVSYTYQGGVHGSPGAAVATFEAQSGRQLAWDDLVTDKAAFITLAEKKFREVRADLFYPVDGSEPFEFTDDQPFALPQQYGLSSEGIYCHYVPYEVGPYAIGNTQMTIPFSEMGDLSKFKSAAQQSAPAGKNSMNTSEYGYPYFGSIDLSNWKKKASKRGSAVYVNSVNTLKIDTISNAQGYQILQTLIGKNGAPLRTRSLVFSTDPNRVTETVTDFATKPARQYARSESLSDDYHNLKPLPAAADGAQWVERPVVKEQAPNPGKPEVNEPVRQTSPAKPARSITRPVVTLKQNGDMLLDGKAVSDLESLRKTLQAKLLTYTSIPDKVDFVTVGQTGMGMRSEIRTTIDESIAGAKWVRKKAAIAALNAAVGKKLGTATQLEMGTYQTSGGFAYISARPLQANGAAIDYSLTPYAQDQLAAWFSDNVIGLLRYEKGAWKVLTYTIGVTRAPADVWSKKYGAPKAALFGKTKSTR